MGWPWNEKQPHEDLSKLDSWYLGDGWYCDGEPSQIDYYIPFGMHYYGLIYAWCMEREDPERSRRFKERAARFAEDFLYWFEDGGRAVPFGRSLTYRFAQSACFSALAFAGVEALPWGVIPGTGQPAGLVLPTCFYRRRIAHRRVCLSQPVHERELQCPWLSLLGVQDFFVSGLARGPSLLAG